MGLRSGLRARDGRGCARRFAHGLSRFLNVVDGIVGQGLRILVLVTTNEPLKRLHPAVSRPGRCLARVEFVAFSCEEAAGWLEARGVMGVADPPGTLAGLYAVLAGGASAVEPVSQVGFGRE